MFDVLVVGGGINGAVAALALASHGMKVGLVEGGDFGSGTSQESSNMVWGGFKYLSSYDLGLVAGLCRSRNRLARAYPTRVVETRFMAALGEDAPFAPWFAAIGANAYWGLGRFRTRRPRHRSPAAIRRLEPAVSTAGVAGGIEYSDYLLVDNDARFVSEMVLDAERHGATVANYVTLEAVELQSSGWRAGIHDRVTGERLTVSARLLVNAAGPHVPVVGALTGSTTSNRLVFSKGVHLIVPQITDSGRILAFFDDEERLFYVLPMGGRSVIGTTDTRVEDPDVVVTDQDIDFLLEQISARLNLSSPLIRSDVISERCGVRSLVVPPGGADDSRDWTELSRRHAVEVDPGRRIVSVLGGKLSDCLNVGQEVVAAARLCGVQPMAPAGAWFGEPGRVDRARFDDRAASLGVAGEVAASLWRRQGRRSTEILDLIAGDPGLGEPMGGLSDLTGAEAMTIARHEKVVHPEDFLRRRTMLALLHRSVDLAVDPGVRRALEIVCGGGSADVRSAGQDEARDQP
jgi:glycerol-3-phosphate dehydrogenase